MCAPWKGALRLRRVGFVKSAENIGAGGAELGPFTGTVFCFGIFGFSAAAFRSPFREKGAEGKIFFRCYSVANAVGQGVG